MRSSDHLFLPSSGLPHWTKTVWNFAFNSGLNSASRKTGISTPPPKKTDSLKQASSNYGTVSGTPLFRRNDQKLSFKRDKHVNREADCSSICYEMKIIGITNQFQYPACNKMNPMNKISAFITILPTNFPVLRTCLEKSLKSLPRTRINKFRFPSLPLETTNNLAPFIRAQWVRFKFLTKWPVLIPIHPAEWA